MIAAVEWSTRNAPELAVRFVEEVSASEPLEVVNSGDYDEYVKCRYCNSPACSDNEVEHREWCPYELACAVMHRIRMEGVPW